MANSRDTPDERSIDWFIDVVGTHNKVVSVHRRQDEYLLDVLLENNSTLVVFMTNLYVVGEADVLEIISNHDDVDCIVTLFAWNRTSSEAVEYGREHNIGVFIAKEFLGAINYNKYWQYEQIPVHFNNAQAAAERRRRSKAWN